MRWYVFIAALLVTTNGCSRMGDWLTPVPKQTARIDVASPAKAIQSDSEAIRSEAGAIQEKSQNVAVSRHAGTIRGKSENISKLAGGIKRKQSEITDLSQTVEREKRKNQREVSHIWTWLQIAGVVVAGLGVAAAIYLGRMSLGIGCGLGGFAVAGAARMWQQYWWVVVLALAVLMVGAFIYVVWWAGENRKALMRQLFGWTQGGEGSKILNETQRKGEKRKVKQK